MNATLLKTTITTDFEEYVERINRLCINLQDFDKEVVDDNLAYEAYSIIRNIKIEEAGDVLLYCCSMNLLNTYVKQKNSKIGYGFKDDIHYMTSILLNLDIEDVYIDYQDSESLLVVQIFSIQFSFHYVKKKNEIISLCNSHHHKKLEWDGIRKQKCAVSLFKKIRLNTLRTCGLTYRGKDLNDKIAKMMSVYKEGKSNFESLLRS